MTFQRKKPMPNCFSVEGYAVYFWSNENSPLEPVHVHVSKGRRSPNTTKVWILSDGTVELDSNKSHISEPELRRILRLIEDYAGEIVSKWEEYFNVPATFIR